MTRGRRRGGVAFAVRDWNSRMLEEAEDGTRRGTRWWRGACAFLPAAVGIGVIGSAIAEGALAASFNLNGSPFVLESNGVMGNGFGGVLNSPNVGAGSGTATPMARIGFASASLYGLCGIVTQSFGPLNFNLLISAGATINPGITALPGPTGDINASDLYIETASLKASGPTVLANAVLGQSGDTVTVDGKSMGGTPGAFGLAASGGTVSLVGLNASAYDAEISGNLSLPGLKISVAPASGTPTC